MAADARLKIAGLFTNGNINSTVPPGALIQAANVVVRANGQLEPRRGFTQGASITSPSAMGFYQSGLIYHGNTTSLTGYTAWNTGATSYSGSYSAVDSSLLRMKFVEANQNLYFNTSVGLKVLTALSSTPTTAGVQAPNDPRFVTSESGLTGAPGASGSWLAKNTAVGYRALLGIRDANNNLKLSAPSGRYVVINPNDASVAIGGMSRTANVVTVTTLAAHGFKVNDQVTLDAVDASFGAATTTYTITTVPTTTTFTYAEAGANSPPFNVAAHTYTSGTKSVAFNVDFLPSSVTTSHFIRLYRTTASATASADPGDEHYQIYERRLTSAEVAAGTLSITDNTPESSLYSSPLYTNPKTGDGITAANDLAPISKDLCLWKERLWFANTTGKQRYTLQILGIGTPDGIQDGDILVIGGIPFYWSNRFGGSTTAIYSQVNFTAALLPSQNIVWSSQQLVDKINSLWRAGTVSFRARYISSLTDAPGKILIETDNPSTTAFYIGASRVTSYSPTPAANAVVLNTSSGSAGTVTVNTSASHGFVTGDQVYLGSLTPQAAYPVGVKTITRISATQFTYAEAGTGAFNTTYVVHKLDQKSDNDARPNGIMFSQYQQPEGVPTANYFTVGAKNKQILRIVPLRDKLYVFKEDGLYTVSNAPPFQSVDLLDPTCILIAPDSAVVLGGKIYAFTRQGVVTVTESGVGVISYPIEDVLEQTIQLLSSSQVKSGFACGYESDRLYIMFTNGDNTLPWVYNYMTQGWTTWQTPVSLNHIGVNPATDKLILLSSSAGGNVDFQENKTGFGWRDYYDSTASLTVTAVDSTALTANLNSGVSVGTLVIDSNGSPMLFTGGGSTNVPFVYDASYGVPVTGAATKYTPISTTVLFAKNSGGQPGAMKHWKEVTLHFSASNIYSFNATFSNSQGVTDSSVATPAPAAWSYDVASDNPNSRHVRVLVPLENQRGSFLQAGFTVSQGRGYWRLDGITYDVDPTSMRVQR